MPKLSYIVSAVLVLSACGKSKDESTTSPSTSDCNSSLSFTTDIKSIVSSGGSGACAGCHPGYDTLSGLQSNKTKVYSEVSSGRMPEGNASFKSSADGQKLISWLSCSTLK
ncbi:hypothetical protein EBU99_08445 [bacterium]|nr:hypothetical protein [bacterium]